MALTLVVIVFFNVKPRAKTHGVKTAIIIPFVKVCKLFVPIMNILIGEDILLKYVIFPTNLLVYVVSDILNISKYSLVV
jgi:hypothetical protein